MGMCTVTELIEARLSEVRVREMKPLYHIGDLSKLDPSKASEWNYEGKGLSVSHYPDSWVKVGGGHVSGDVWSLHKPDARFHMAYSGQKKATKWAHEQGLIEPTKVYQISYFDEYLGFETADHYSSRKELEQEHGPAGVDVAEVVDTHKLTKKGHARASELGGKENPSTLASLAYAHHHDYDGVYWHHDHDVGLSAPAGTIFQHKLSGFKRKKVKETGAIGR